MGKLAVLLPAAALALAVAVGVPAHAGEPVEQRVAALTRKVAALQAKVRLLEREKQNVKTENRQLAELNRALLADHAILRRALAHEASCPVTMPNGNSPPDQQSPRWHGNGSLWIALGQRGVTVPGDGQVGSDGSLRTKFGWWRGVTGDLTIERRRLDQAAPPFSTVVSPEGYGETGLLPSGITFPSEGCWQVTGTVGATSLSFVVLVITG